MPLRRRASSALNQFVVLSLLATLLAVIALAVGAGRAAATPETLCNGGLASGVMGGPHDFLIDVPADATLTVAGTLWIPSPGLGGEVLKFTPDSGWDYQSDLMPDGPISYSTSHTWTAPHTDTYPLKMTIDQAYGTNVEFALTFRVSATHGCAAHTGTIRGGHNESEPSSCNCTKDVVKPVSTDSGNFYHSFTDFSLGGRGPGLGLARTYNSSAAAIDGSFGYGWQSSAGITLVENPASTPANIVTITQEGGSESVFTPTTGGNYSVSSYTDAVLTKQAGVGWTFVRDANTTMQFNTAGRLTSLTDSNSEYINFGYNGSNQLTTITDRAGRTLTFSWTGTHVTSVADSSAPARTVSYHYNASGEMDYSTDVAGSTTSFTYDGSHRMLTTRDPRNQGAPTPTM